MGNRYILNLKYESEGDIFEEDMSIEFTTHSIIRLNRIRDQIGDFNDLHKRVLFLLEQIPQFLLEEVRIGETFAVFDWFLHISFAIQMQEDRLKVITLFDESEHHLGKSLKLYEGEQVVEFSATDISYSVFKRLEERTITDL